MHCDSYGHYHQTLRPYLIKVEWRQVVSAHGPLLGAAALLQSFVSGQEETHPGAGGGGRVLTRQQEANQHPGDLVITQGSSVSEGETKSLLELIRAIIIF